jgi:hypothetical protein
MLEVISRFPWCLNDAIFPHHEGVTDCRQGMDVPVRSTIVLGKRFECGVMMCNSKLFMCVPMDKLEIEMLLAELVDVPAWIIISWIV